jgi:xylose isomerase
MLFTLASPLVLSMATPTSKLNIDTTQAAAAAASLLESPFSAMPETIPFEGPTSKNPLAYKFYNKDEVIMGKPMSEWLRFAVCYWHTWKGNGADPFGIDGTISRPWDDTNFDTPLDAALARVDVHFDFCKRLGVDFYCFHDRDVSPEGSSVEETECWFDVIADKLAAKQEETGISLLWGTSNLFSHKRYMHGAATNPDPEVMCMAAAQVQKCLDVTKRLGGENFVLWGGRDGYQTLLNTDYGREQKNYAAFLTCVADYADSIGFDGQLLLEPKPREPSAHQYNFDSETTLGFLDHFGLIDRYALNLEANHGTLAGHSGEHEVEAAASRGKLGSVDANRDEALLGWDTDMFPTDLSLSTYLMKRVIEQDGLQPGGLNFDAKVRRESTDLEDLFIGHINGMDCYARGLRAAAHMIEHGELDNMVAARYAGFDASGSIGEKFSSGGATLSDLAEHARAAAEVPPPSGKQERYESIFNSFAFE